MTINRFALAAVLIMALAPQAPACLSGWDCCKWNDVAHQTPKYVVGRIIANYPHTPAGLKQALPLINTMYPGTTILAGKGDVVHIPCVGTVDLIVGAGNGGEAWWWGASEGGNECNKCKPNRCEAVSQSVKCKSGMALTAAGKDVTSNTYGCAGVKVPNRLSVVQQTANDNPEAWKGKLNPDEAACRADSRYLDLVVDNLRREDKRWGYNCKRGNCNDPSHDVVAYYFGTGEPYEGAPQVMLVDMITGTCDPGAHPGWLVLPFGEGAGWTSKGRFPSGQRQNIKINCPKNNTSSPSFTVAPIRAPSKRPASPKPSSAADNGPGTEGEEEKPQTVIGGSKGNAPVDEAPAQAEEKETGGANEETPQ